MKITIKKVKTMDGHEGLAYSGDVYINGVYVGRAINDGNGGELCLHFYSDKPKVRELIGDAEIWAKNQPDMVLEYGEGKTLTFKSNLQEKVDAVFNEYFEQKEKEKLVKAQKVEIQWGVPNSYGYTRIRWKGLTLEQVAQKPQGLLALQTRINTIKRDLKDGEEIFNAEYLRSLGCTV